MPMFESASLYVGDLETNVKEEQLYELFNRVTQVISVRVCQDLATKQSLGYGYVNLTNFHDAPNVMKRLNYTPVNGKPIRIMFSHRDSTIRMKSQANLFIKNLDFAIDNKALHELFSTFGTILSCKVATNINGESKGHGFVQFEEEEAASNAISRLNGMLINDKQVYVGPFIRRQDRYQGETNQKFTNVYVKNLSEDVSDEALKSLFSPFGAVSSAVVMKDENGKSKCFGFVNFESPDFASEAVQKMNGSSQGDKVWYVARAQKKSEREAELKVNYQQDKLARFEKFQGCNLYIKNLEDNIDDSKLNEIFSEFGTITSCKVMIDVKGTSKGCGFVAFGTKEEASRVLSEMNGKMVRRKPLYIAVAERKEERKARLQAHFNQLQTQARMSFGMPGFLHGPPRMPPQQLYYGQGSPGLMPPQPPGYVFQHQMIRPNSMIPYNQHRIGMRHPGNAHQQQHQQQQQQMGKRHWYQGFRRNGVDPSFARPPLSSIIMPALHTANPEQQKYILGEHLYPLVHKIDRENAEKVTGMLLELDQSEVLHLIESSDALRKKVSEALDVLRRASC